MLQILNMRISEDGTHLEVNGYTLYPTAEPGLQLSQVSSDIPFEVLTTSLQDVASESRLADYARNYRTFPAADGSDAKVVELDLQILSLGQENVNVDKVHVRLLQGSSAEPGLSGLVIHEVALVPVTGTVVSLHDMMREAMDIQRSPCANADSLYCRIRNYLASKTFSASPNTRLTVSRKPGCYGRRPQQGPPGPNIKGGPNKFWHVYKEDDVTEISTADLPNLEDITQVRPITIKGGPNKFWQDMGLKIDEAEVPTTDISSSKHITLPPADNLPVYVKGGPHKSWGIRPEGGELANPVEVARKPHHRVHRGQRGCHRGHRGHGHRYALHRVMHFLHQFVAGFVIPVMIGIAAGLTASVLGMLVGSCIAWLWIKLIRGGRRGNASVESDAMEKYVIDSDEKKRVIAQEEEIAGDEPLPVYVESEKQ